MSDQPRIGILLSQANAAREAGDLPGADALCRQILRLDPGHSGAIQFRVAIANTLGRPGDALAILDEAARAAPINPSWPLSRALILTSLGRHAEALAASDQAIALSPLDHTLHRARAAQLFESHRFEEALAGYDASIAQRPDVAESHIDRAETLRRLNHFDEALAAYDRATDIEPESARAWYGKAMLLLLMGHYKDGWALHEWRLFTPNFPEPERLLPRPLWDGEPLSGRTLLVRAEQGLGDSIQFYRFVLQVRRQGKIAVLVPPKLARLFATQPDAPPVATDTDHLPHYDLHCPMPSLPFLLGTELATLPSAPYLRADPAIAAAWRARLPQVPGRLRVGIVWAGNKTQENDRDRSMKLETMLAMLDPDLTVISLQKDVPESDRTTLLAAAHVLDLSESLTDFADTAAVISELDLVITVCTSVAHLAGAMGTPVWVLLSTSADWRWLIGREDSPWYPSARLFRQDKAGDWTDAARRVREALKTITVPA